MTRDELEMVLAEYVDGTLAELDRRAVETALKAHPDLALEVELARFGRVAAGHMEGPTMPGDLRARILHATVDRPTLAGRVLDWFRALPATAYATAMVAVIAGMVAFSQVQTFQKMSAPGMHKEAVPVAAVKGVSEIKSKPTAKTMNVLEAEQPAQLAEAEPAEALKKNAKTDEAKPEGALSALEPVATRGGGGAAAAPALEAAKDSIPDAPRKSAGPMAPSAGGESSVTTRVPLDEVAAGDTGGTMKFEERRPMMGAAVMGGAAMGKGAGLTDVADVVAQNRNEEQRELELADAEMARPAPPVVVFEPMPHDQYVRGDMPGYFPGEPEAMTVTTGEDRIPASDLDIPPYIVDDNDDAALVAEEADADDSPVITGRLVNRTRSASGRAAASKAQASFASEKKVETGTVADKSIGGVEPSIIAQYDGTRSGWTRAGRMVIRDEGTWAAYWRMIHAAVADPPPLPPVDFSRQIVLAVGLGSLPTNGFAVSIRSIRAEGSRLFVRVARTVPHAGDLVAETFTQPYSIVVLDLGGTLSPDDVRVIFGQ